MEPINPNIHDPNLYRDYSKFTLQEEPWTITHTPNSQKKFKVEKKDKAKKKNKPKKDSPWIPKHLQETNDEE